MHIKHKWTEWSEPRELTVAVSGVPLVTVVQDRQCKKCRRLYVRRIKAQM